MTRPKQTPNEPRQRCGYCRKHVPLPFVDAAAYNNREQIVEEITDLLVEMGCAVNRPAMLELSVYITERERMALEELMAA